MRDWANIIAIACVLFHVNIKALLPAVRGSAVLSWADKRFLLVVSEHMVFQMAPSQELLLALCIFALEGFVL